MDLCRLFYYHQYACASTEAGLMTYNTNFVHRASWTIYPQLNTSLSSCHNIRTKGSVEMILASVALLPSFDMAVTLKKVGFHLVGPI